MEKTAGLASKRDELVKYAYDLFYKNGFHATGVDVIVAGILPKVEDLIARVRAARAS